MNYMERENSESKGMLELVLKHAGIMKNSYLIILLLALAGLLAGIAVQWSKTDTYTKEVLLKSGNGLYSDVIANMIQPTRVLFANQNSGLGQTSKKPNNTSVNTQATGALTFENNWASLIKLGNAPDKFQSLNLQVLFRTANSKNVRIAAVRSLPTDSRLSKRASLGEDQMNQVIKKFKITNLKRGADEILVRFEGKSAAETESAIDALLTILRDQFTDLERERIKTALKSKLLIVDTQIRERENVVQRTVNPYGDENRALEIKRAIQSDPILIALKSDKEEVEAFSIDKLDVEPFTVIPIDMSKNTSIIKSNLWLVITTLAGLLAGLVIAYLIHGFRVIKTSK